MPDLQSELTKAIAHIQFDDEDEGRRAAPGKAPAPNAEIARPHLAAVPAKAAPDSRNNTQKILDAVERHPGLTALQLRDLPELAGIPVKSLGSIPYQLATRGFLRNTHGTFARTAKVYTPGAPDNTKPEPAPAAKPSEPPRPVAAAPALAAPYGADPVQTIYAAVKRDLTIAQAVELTKKLNDILAPFMDD